MCPLHNFIYEHEQGHEAKTQMEQSAPYLLCHRRAASLQRWYRGTADSGSRGHNGGGSTAEKILWVKINILT